MSLRLEEAEQVNMSAVAQLKDCLDYLGKPLIDNKQFQIILY